jgi:RNA polymerase sigma-70 factor (ECF subfamily)
VTDPAPRDSEASDELVVIRCLIGERDAFDLLIERWYVPVRRYVMRATNDADAAGDLLQDVWLRVLRGLPSLRDPSRFRPWLFGIARRVLMDRLRARYAEPSFAGTETDELPAGDDSGRTDDLEILEHELGQLPLIEREVLQLFYIEELSLNDIAEIAAVPVGTVKSRLFRARRMLRALMMKKGVQA